MHGGQQPLLLFGAVNGVVARAVLQLQSGPVDGDLDVPELALPLLVGRGVSQGVVVGAVLDDVGQLLFQAVRVVVGPATRLTGDTVPVSYTHLTLPTTPYV